jgi:hypothetical protein
VRNIRLEQAANKLRYAAIPGHGFPLSVFKAMPTEGRIENKKRGKQL